MSKPIIEIETVAAIPALNAGGRLELKAGKMCLRMADNVVMEAHDKFKITRKWLPPGKLPWNPDYYAKAN